MRFGPYSTVGGHSVGRGGPASAGRFLLETCFTAAQLWLWLYRDSPFGPLRGRGALGRNSLPSRASVHDVGLARGIELHDVCHPAFKVLKHDEASWLFAQDRYVNYTVEIVRYGMA